MKIEIINPALIIITSLGISIFWRTCIYSRGGIFRFIGRTFDKWTNKACDPTATIWNKILRFISYPLGKCIYCSSFHFTYDTFFLLNYKMKLNLDWSYLLIIIPITHLMVIMYMKLFISNNSDMTADDWEYIKGTNKVFDLKQRRKKVNYILTKEEEEILSKCKGDSF